MVKPGSMSPIRTLLDLERTLDVLYGTTAVNGQLKINWPSKVLIGLDVADQNLARPVDLQLSVDRGGAVEHVQRAFQVEPETLRERERLGVHLARRHRQKIVDQL